ncbi:hypothetical protein [Leifsonia aquatica]|uniref:hypothetical protein n=1 Tax=Leifsonia aquatica TaxID=144185 RepID=UPI000B169704|nr:hypothetical protein [Leifsonia aquatica]
MRRRRLLPATLSVLGAAATAALLTVAPTAAVGVPGPVCLTDCSVFFDTPSSGAMTFPVGISSLTATVNGGAGAQVAAAISPDPAGAGGTGGSATIDLGPSYAGKTVQYRVGGVGGGSSIAADGSTLAIAGGGGGAGYAGLLTLPDQVFASYPGGAGGAPATTGVTPGGSGTAFGPLPANGIGGSTVGGAGGTGVAPGTAGQSPAGGLPVSGGVGSTITIGAFDRTGGSGGGGYAGGGAGGIMRNVSNGDLDIDVVAPGGGGSGYLAPGLTASANPGNPGIAEVTFTWSFSPVATTTASAAAVHPGATVPVSVTGLPVGLAFTATFDGTTVFSGSTDAAGAATFSFVLANSQRAGSFPVQIVVDGAAVAGTAAVTVAPVVAPAADPAVPAAELAATGSSVPWIIVGVAVVLLAGGAVLLVLRARRGRSAR